MTQPQSPVKAKPSLLKRIAYAVLAIWFLLYLCIWVLSPMAVRHFAAQPLSDLNLQLHNDSSVRFNPFTSTLSLDDVALIDTDNKQVFGLAEGEISIHLHRLLLSQLYVSKFTISQVMLDVVATTETQNPQLFVAGIDLNAPAQQLRQNLQSQTLSQQQLILYCQS
jgi:hypothetical protein